MEETWYKLDNAAKIYPALREKNWAPIFRMDAVLKSEVDPASLQLALAITYKRFPTFSVNIARGLFWYYFEPKELEPEITAENMYPLRPFSEERDNGYLFRVLYYKKRISLEVFHAISDGFGGAVFLKTLLFNYFMVLNDMKPVSNLLELDKYGILYYKDLPTPQEVEDSFQNYALEDIGLALKEKLAFSIPGTRIKKKLIRVAHILMNVRTLHKLAKVYDSTITEFLTSLLIYSILHARVYRVSDNKPIKISVPVNLRKRFPSKTMRNFSSYINVEVFPSKSASEINIEEICEAVKRQIREGTNADILRTKFSSNVTAEKKIVMRVAPLFLKNIVLKSTYSLYGERLVTSTLSNTGSITLPQNMAHKVERFDFLCGVPKQNAMNCGVVSFEDTISISFTSIIMENCIIKNFVDFLVQHEIEIKVETNY